MSNPDQVLRDSEDAMSKSLEHLKRELRGVRTGRATPALVEFVKVEAYGTTSDLKALASIAVTDATQLLIKPFDPSILLDIKRGLEASGIGLNPIADGKQLRINLPALSGDRRKQLVAHCRKLTEETKVSLRNARRDGNKHADALAKAPGAHYPEDEIDTLKHEIQDLLKKYEHLTDDATDKKIKEIEEV